MSEANLLSALFDLTNSLVELYLANIIKPFLILHEKFYKALNETLRSFLDDQSNRIPKWFTANFITYTRTLMVLPCILLMVHGHTFLPSIIILGVDFGDFLDGVVARYWVDQKWIDSVDKDMEDTPSKKKNEDEDYVVDVRESWIVAHRNKTYGGFIDAVCDKAFLIPCWISLLNSVPGSGYAKIMQYIVLWCLILTETVSGCIRFKAYYTSNGIAAPAVKGLDFSTSAVKADHIGKAKQTFEMFGTAFYVWMPLRYLGLLLMTAAVPLAYESVRRKVKKRVIYVDGTTDKLDHETLKFWKQAKGLGSKLLVGISKNDKNMISNASACESVDGVIVNAPNKLSLAYLGKIGVDYVVCGVGKSECVVSSEVVAARRCLVIVDDETCQPMDSKGSKAE